MINKLVKIIEIVPLIFWCHLCFIDAQVLFLNTTTVPSVTFYPSDLGVFRIGDHRNLTVSLWTANGTAWLGTVSIDCDQLIGCPLELNNNGSSQSPPLISGASFVQQLDRFNNFSHFFNLSLRGAIVGINRVHVLADGKKIQNLIVRTRKTESGTAFTILFTKSLIIAIVTGNFMAGIQLNLCQTFANFLHYFCFIFATIICQFIINPILGFFLANYVLFHQPFIIRLSFFLVTCCPAGVGKSNFWTMIFGGDLQAAGILTFVQRLGTLFSMPLWIMLVGKKFFVNRVKIYKIHVRDACAIIIVPFLIGMLLACCGCREKMKKIAGIFKFFFCGCTILFLALSILANWALFCCSLVHQFDLLLCCAVLFPLFSHFFALTVGFCLRLSPAQRTTIAVENAVPNVGVAMLLLLCSMGEPEKDIAMLAPICMALLAEKPLLLLCIVKICYRTFKRNSVESGNVAQQQHSPTVTAAVIPAEMTNNAMDTDESVTKNRNKQMAEIINEKEI